MSKSKPVASKAPKRSAKPKERDPVAIIESSNAGRVEELVPIRHSRMSVSPFTFYRGAAAVIAADLSTETHSGILVQSCGDCHILNFGAFATPERNIIIDLNDFDETHPAPFEWDLKRLAASLVLAANSAGMSAKSCERAAFEVAASYQKEMLKHADSRLLDIWYSKFDYQAIIDQASRKVLRDKRRKNLAKEVMKSSPEALQKKLIEKKKGQWRFKEMPPLLYHMPDLTVDFVRNSYAQYLQSLSHDRAGLLGHFELTDIAMKVVGTGSVGTFCAVLLLVGANEDFLILQVKEARQSVLEPYMGASKFENHGQRIVVGQRIMQSASDLFLGWTKGDGKAQRHFYIRQLRDVKMSPNPAIWDKASLYQAGAFAGQILAKAHAKSGQSREISNYIGKGDRFAKAMAKYAMTYAETTESDYKLFIDACRSRRLPTEASVVG